MNIELWADINGFEGIYQVSTLGCVRVLPRIVDHPNGRQFRRGKILKPVLMNSGYLTVTLAKDKKLYPSPIHTIVADTFIPNPDNLDQINHINGIKTDNRLLSLERCTRSQNMKHAIKHGLAQPPAINRKKFINQSALS